MRIKSERADRSTTTANRFRKRRPHTTPDLYNIQYSNGVEWKVYQFEDVERTCILCDREKAGLFYCRIPEQLQYSVLRREEIIENNSVCTVCANRSLI